MIRSENKLSIGSNYKLVITIIKKGMGTKVALSAKKAGADSETIILGRGTADKNVYLEILGIDYEPEKEIVFSVAKDENTDDVLKTITKESLLDKPGRGIAFVVEMGGLVYMNEKVNERVNENASKNLKESPSGSVSENIIGASYAGKEGNIEFNLIVTIVNKGKAWSVVEASKKAGAEGGTIMGGRGTGIHENLKILGIPIEPEKEIVLTLVPDNITEKVLDSITKDAELNKTGKGIAFILNVEKAVGICHALNKNLSGNKDR